jgi:tetratricopeptide (TPR) repeat protein
MDALAPVVAIGFFAFIIYLLQPGSKAAVSMLAFVVGLAVSSQLISSSTPGVSTAGTILLLMTFLWGLYFGGRGLIFLIRYSAKEKFDRLFRRKGDLYRGVRAIVKGKWEEGLELLGRYDRIRPNDPESLAWRASALLQLRRYTGALDIAERSLNLKETIVGRSTRASILIALGASDDAIADLQRTIEIAPEWPATVARDLIAGVLIGQGRVSHALELLPKEKSLAKYPYGSYVRGEAHRRLGQEDIATRHYRDACKQAQQFVNLSRIISLTPLLVCALARAGKLEEAEKAAAQLPESGVSPSPLYARALLALKQERYGEARDALQRLVRIVPHEVVVAFEDPDFAVLLRDYNCEELLAEARRERERILESIRWRSGASFEQHPGPAFDTGGLRP